MKVKVAVVIFFVLIIVYLIGLGIGELLELFKGG